MTHADRLASLEKLYSDPERTAIAAGAAALREVAELRAQVLSLHAVTDATADVWLKADLGIPFEGSIDGAMRAACGEIVALRARMEDAEASRELHVKINKRAADALGKPSEGERSSWHDIPEEITTLRARMEDARKLAAFAMADGSTPDLRAAARRIHAAIAEARKPAALAEPAPEGDVVEQAARVLFETNARREGFGPLTDALGWKGEQHKWMDAARALASAGLLAGPWPDKERLAQFIRYRLVEGDPAESSRQCADRLADAILREWGGR